MVAARQSDGGDVGLVETGAEAVVVIVIGTLQADHRQIPDGFHLRLGRVAARLVGQHVADMDLEVRAGGGGEHYGPDQPLTIVLRQPVDDEGDNLGTKREADQQPAGALPASLVVIEDPLQIGGHLLRGFLLPVVAEGAPAHDRQAVQLKLGAQPLVEGCPATIAAEKDHHGGLGWLLDRQLNQAQVILDRGGVGRKRRNGQYETE